MYLRTVQRRNRDGSVVRYVQLAHNFRHPQTGRPQAQVLWSFGREEEVDRAQLERLVRSIERFLSPEQALQRQARDHEVPLRFLEWTYPALVDRVTLTDSGFADHLLSNSSGDRYPRAECRLLRL
jgi:hypothetical protein